MKKHLTFQKMVMVFSAIAILFAFSSCGNKNAKRFKEATMKLDNTSYIFDDYDDWPEGGLRNMGGHLASLISLSELEKMLPCPLYVSGPHHDGQWDLYSDDFGHYNPQAVQSLVDIAKKVVADKKFVAASKPLVNKYLFYQMHSLMAIHDVMYDEEMFDREGRNQLFAYCVDEVEYPYYFLGNLFTNDDSDVFDYYKYEFFSFWARRWKDGTIDQFYDGLSTIFKAYYPDYEYNLEDYYFEDWGDDAYYGETAYDCELEPDEPVTAAERIKENDAVKMLREATGNLDKTHLVLSDEFDYWPECGIRVMGGHLFSLISLKTLNRMLPCDLYVSGPHTYNHWELDIPDDFGHYNPEAIQYLGNLAKKVVADKGFVEKTRPLVDEYLKRQMLIMKGLYDGLNDKNIVADKNQVLSDIMASGGRAYASAGEFLNDMDSQLEDGTYVYGNTGEMFLYWWSRRNFDGTMEQFHDILETVYNAYYGK